MKALSKLKKPLFFVLLVLIAVNIVFGVKYKVAYVQGESMEPTHAHSEWIIIERVSSLGKEWSPERYDIVLIKKNNELLCKRVIGTPGDKIEIREGLIYLNGIELEDPFGWGKMGYYVVDENDNNLKYWNGPEKGKAVYELISQNEITIPKGNVWIIGDNRGYSWFGMLPVKGIEGLLIL